MTQPNGLQSLVQSRRFWMAILSAVLAIVLRAVSQFLPSQLDFVQFLIDQLTPLALLVIGSFTVTDSLQIITAAQTQMHQNALDAQVNMHNLTLISQGKQ